MTTNRAHRLYVEDQLTAEALDIQVGESRKIVCPFCRATHEMSLSLSRTEEGLLYKCFRVKCGARGFISSIPGTTRIDLPDKKKVFTPREFKHDLTLLPDEIYTWLFNKYYITKEEADNEGFRYEPKYNRIYMPVFDEQGSEFGAVTKAIERGTDVPKTLTYITRDTSRVHFSRQGLERRGPLCVVEDVLSAVRVSRYLKTCALLGTTINNEKIRTMRSVSSSLIMILDNDAIELALRFRKRYGFYFGQFRVMMPEKDPKDMSPKELEEFLHDYVPQQRASSMGGN